MLCRRRTGRRRTTRLQTATGGNPQESPARSAQASPPTQPRMHTKESSSPSLFAWIKSFILSSPSNSPSANFDQPDTNLLPPPDVKNYKVANECVRASERHENATIEIEKQLGGAVFDPVPPTKRTRPPFRPVIVAGTEPELNLEDSSLENLNTTQNALDRVHSAAHQEHCLLKNVDSGPETHDEIMPKHSGVSLDVYVEAISCPGRKWKDKEVSEKHSLAGDGITWESGVRRGTRLRTRPLEFWNAERLLNGHAHDNGKNEIEKQLDGAVFDPAPPTIRICQPLGPVSVAGTEPELNCEESNLENLSSTQNEVELGHAWERSVGEGSSKMVGCINADSTRSDVNMEEDRGGSTWDKVEDNSRPASKRRDKKVYKRHSLAGAGTTWESGVRRSKRFRTRPLKFWKGERLLYGRVHDSLITVIGIKYNSPGKGLTVKSFVSDEYKDLVESAALH